MNKIKAIIVVLFLLVLFSQPFLGMDTKTAYTRDGINFVSKARMEENIKYEYAKPGDYKEVHVPMDTIVVGASEYLEDTSNQRDTKIFNTDYSKQITTNIISENILIILIGLLFCSAIIFTRMKKNNKMHIGELKGTSFNSKVANIAQKPKTAPRDLPDMHTTSAEDAQYFINEEITDLIIKGGDLSGVGKYGEAIKCYDKAILLGPKWDSAWSGKGNVFFELGKYDEALKCYDEALRLDPGNYAHWSDKALALEELGNIAKSSYCNGIALQIFGHREEAEKAFKKAKELGLSDQEVLELNELLESGDD